MRLLHVTPSNLHTKLPPTPVSCQVTRKSVSDTQTPENQVCPAGRGCHLCSPGDGASPPLEETVSPQDTGAHGSVGPGREGRPRLTARHSCGPVHTPVQGEPPALTQPRVLLAQRGAGRRRRGSPGWGHATFSPRHRGSHPQRLVPLACCGHFSEPLWCLPMAGRW